MLWIKLGGIGCMFLCICAGGFLYSGRYYARSRELMRAVAIVSALHQRLVFTLDTPQSLFLWLEHSPSLRCEYITEACRLMGGGVRFQSAFALALRQSKLQLLPEDRQILGDLADILGTSDLETQEMRLLLLSDALKVQQNRAQEREEEQKKLAQTLSILCGLAVCIFLI